MTRLPVPHLRIDGLDQAAQVRLRFIGEGLQSLADHCTEFEAVLLLHEEVGAEDEEIFRLPFEKRRPGSEAWQRNALIDRWSALALREGAAILNRYSEDLGVLTENIRACPPLLDQISWPRLRRCTRRFRAFFGDAIQVRHATSHSRGHISGTPEKHAENIGHHWAVGGMAGPEFETVMKRQRVAYRLSRENADTLDGITLDYFGVFEELDVVKRFAAARKTDWVSRAPS